MILSDFDLRAYLESGRLRVIPFSDEIIRENGLDLRIGSK
ncbi:MAG TPA: dCTP deaminase, partial [Acidilobales archaeon]|nr:dCTP deaminase [Acidilobales archaeon]